jgi:L-histidine Nalpha-methyltransferase
MNIEQFKKDIKNGLSKESKTLPSKYFYDKKGDKLFVEIMNLPEYYLTRSEFEIFSLKSLELIQQLGLVKETYFELIELGAGDGSKTIELLKPLVNGSYLFKYTPIDISANTLDVLEKNIHAQLPHFKVDKLAGDYFGKLNLLKQTPHPKVILFLGSNIGNLTDEQSSRFLNEIANNLNTGDKLVLGLDLRKSKSIVLPAYSDSKGVTKAFNLNLLDRINKKLGANFIIDQFTHIAEYEEEEGVARSFIVSTAKQEVTINALGETYAFKEGERVHTEISRKYDDVILNDIVKPTAFTIKGKLTDTNNLFADYILEKQ